MKKLSFFGVFVLLCIGIDAIAQVPAGIPYQAVARDVSGNVMANQTVAIRFTVLSDSPSPSTTWFEERHVVATNELGLINLTIGNGILLSGNISSIPWEQSTVRLRVDMDPTGGSTYTVSGLTVFGTVPYAFRSGSSSLSGNGVPNGTTTGQTLRWNGSAWVTSSNLINNGTNISINSGTSSPDLALTLGDDVSQDGGIVAKGKFYSSASGATLTTTGTGSRLIWYPRKAAFRAGYANGTSWDDSQIGLNSWAGGYSTIASGNYSFSFGSGSSVSGDFSAAMGSGNQVSGQYSAAFGSGNQVAGYQSFAAGGQNVVSNSYGTAFGYNNTVSAYYSLTSGQYNKVVGENAHAFGYNNFSRGDYSMTVGFESAARGSRSMAFGQGAIARSWSEIALGSFNTDYTPSDSNSYNSNDRILVIGNGTYSGRRNAMVILKNGNLGLGENSPSENFVVGVGGKLRIDSLGNLKRINNVDYSWPSTQASANHFLKNDGTGNLSWSPVVASASDLTTGTVNDARLSANIFRLDAVQTITGNHSFQDGTLRLWNTGNTNSTILSASSSTSGRTLNFPDASGTVITTGNLNAITGTGNITSGTWNANVIGPAYGGTGLNASTFTNGTLLYYTAGVGWTSLPAGTNGQFLKLVTGTPTWATDVGTGTVTSISTGLGLTGGPITNSGTISIDNAVVPRLNVGNSFVGTQTISPALTTGQGLVIQGIASQSGNLTEWRNSSAATIASVSAAGVFTGSGAGLTNVTAASSTPVAGDLTGTIGNAQIATDAVGTLEIQNGSVASSDIADLTIATADLADNSITTAKISNNSVSGAKIALGSDATGDIMYYNGTDYVRLAAGTDGQILKMSGGIPAWTNPTGTLINSAQASGYAIVPTTTFGFLSPTASVAINFGDKVLVDSYCLFGASTTEARGLNIHVGYKESAATTVTSAGPGVFGLTCPATHRNEFSVSGIITGLATGTYQFGMAGTSSNVYWINNDYCRTRVLVFN